MGQESNGAPGRQQALRGQIPPSMWAGLLRIAEARLDSADSDALASPDGSRDTTRTRHGKTARPRHGKAAGPAAADRRKGKQTAGARPGEPERNETAGARPGGPAPGDPVGARRRPGPGLQKQRAKPSWPRVIGTTARLWARRHLRVKREIGGRRNFVLSLIVGAITIIVAIGLIVVLPRHVATTEPASSPTGKSSGGTGGLGAIANLRRQAAAWVARQVSPSAIVACDPVMCASLQAGGFVAQNLLTLQPSASDPLGSDVVVATAAVRSEFGSRLASVYAPTVIASFGSGAARIDVRPVAPDGAAAYRAELRSDRIARQDAGAQLGLNGMITVPAPARRELADGQVDSRLLITLATIAARYPVRIVAYGGSAPGASPDIPLRSIDIAGAGKSGAAELAPVLAFLQAQEPPYRPMLAKVLRPARDRAVLRIKFGAPSPLGLLGTRG